jgi:simple sugar transport system ATP-binding protein
LSDLSANAAPAEPAVSVSGITKRFSGVVANEDISLDFHAGEVHVLLGENGAGKSTLIAILSGLQQPDEGTLSVKGEQVAIRSPRDAIALGIGCVYQHSTLVPTMTVAENLMLGQPWYRPLRRPATLARLAELSRVLGIAIDPDTRADSLSLGEQQQVEIVKALWRGERVLILDEPTSMLTPQGVKELGAVISRLRAEGLAIIFVTHKLNEVIAFGDRVSILKLGGLAGQIGPVTFRGVAPEQATAIILDLMFGPSSERSPGLVTEFDGKSSVARTDLRRHDATAPSEPVLAIEEITTAKGEREVALNGVSLSVRVGEILGIAGVDGNGQRQLAEALAGQRPLTGGRIVFSGKDISAFGAGGRQQLGLRYLTDDRLGEGTVGTFSVAINLVLKRIDDRPFWRNGIERRRPILDNARELIARYDVRTPGPLTPIAKLSGGNIQKTLFARELDGAPKLVIYNKPTYGLDVANARLARERIRAAADRGVTAILISTELDELHELCDRIAVMDRGRLAGIVDNDDDDAERKVGRLMVAGGAH